MTEMFPRKRSRWLPRGSQYTGVSSESTKAIHFPIPCCCVPRTVFWSYSLMGEPSGKCSLFLSNWRDSVEAWKLIEDISRVVGQRSTARGQSAGQTERDGRSGGNLRHWWREWEQPVFEGLPRQTHHYYHLRPHVSLPHSVSSSHLAGLLACTALHCHWAQVLSRALLLTQNFVKLQQL
jgi:hypothetical protein